MSRSKPINVVAAAAVIPLTALAVAGCGGGSNDATGSTPPPKASNGRAATVSVANNAGLGNILVDSNGRTLYLFKKDSGTKSSCFGPCAKNWPPLRATGKPTAGNGASASSIGTVPRSDGKPEVTYNGHPLYLFAGDSKPGDANGQGIVAFGASWYALSGSGKQISGSSAGGGTSGY